MKIRSAQSVNGLLSIGIQLPILPKPRESSLCSRTPEASGGNIRNSTPTTLSSSITREVARATGTKVTPRETAALASFFHSTLPEARPLAWTRCPRGAGVAFSLNG